MNDDEIEGAVFLWFLYVFVFTVIFGLAASEKGFDSKQLRGQTTAYQYAEEFDAMLEMIVDPDADLEIEAHADLTRLAQNMRDTLESQEYAALEQLNPIASSEDAAQLRNSVFSGWPDGANSDFYPNVLFLDETGYAMHGWVGVDAEGASELVNRSFLEATPMTIDYDQPGELGWGWVRWRNYFGVIFGVPFALILLVLAFFLGASVADSVSEKREQSKQDKLQRKAKANLKHSPEWRNLSNAEEALATLKGRQVRGEGTKAVIDDYVDRAESHVAMLRGKYDRKLKAEIERLKNGEEPEVQHSPQQKIQDAVREEPSIAELAADALDDLNKEDSVSGYEDSFNHNLFEGILAIG